MNKEIVSKGMRLRSPKVIRLQLRPEVYDWLCSSSDDLHCAMGVLARGIIEDAFDNFMSGKTGSMSLTSPPMAAGSTPAPDTKAVECS